MSSKQLDSDDGERNPMLIDEDDKADTNDDGDKLEEHEDDEDNELKL